MANVNAPFGFRPIGRMDGGSPTAGFGPLATIASANPHSFFAGDVCIPLNTGYIDVIGASDTVQVAGVFWQAKYLATAIGRTVWQQYYATGSATGDINASLITDPDQLFIAQSNGAAIVFGDIGSNVNVDPGAGGNTITQQSGMMLDQSSISGGTVATLPFRIVGLWSQWAAPGEPGTDNGSNYNWAVVAPNNWSRKQLTSVG